MSFLDAAKAFMEKGDMELLLLRAPAAAEGPQQQGVPPATSGSRRMRCHSTLLKLASPLLEDLLDACPPPPPTGGPPLALKVHGGDPLISTSPHRDTVSLY